MSEQKIPTLKQVQNKFKRAKEIQCLGSNAITGVKGFTAFEWDANTNAWVGAGGAVVFWKDGVYATITKKVCEPGQCTKCKNCADKKQSNQ